MHKCKQSSFFYDSLSAYAERTKNKNYAAVFIFLQFSDAYVTFVVLRHLLFLINVACASKTICI